jgi:hypothetical protein
MEESLDYVHTMPVRAKTAWKNYEIVRYRHFYRYKTMPVMKTYRFVVSCEPIQKELEIKRHFERQLQILDASKKT